MSTYRVEILTYIGEGGVTAQGVAAAIRGAGGGDTIELVVSSPGGNLFEGVALFNLLHQSPATTRATCIGVAASAATLPWLAGSTRRIVPSGLAMIHDPLAMCVGGAADMRKMGDVLDTCKNSILTIYARQTGLPANQLAAMMSDETWLTADQAKELGFAHAIDGDAQVDNRAWDLRCYRHPPQSVARPGGERPPFALERELFQRVAASYGIVPGAGPSAFPGVFGMSTPDVSIIPPAVRATLAPGDLPYAAEYFGAGGQQKLGISMESYIYSRHVDAAGGVADRVSRPKPKPERPGSWLTSELHEPARIF